MAKQVSNVWYRKYGSPAENVIRMWITPEIAKEWVNNSKGFKNRNKKSANIELMISDVEDGNFTCNGETIVLGIDGTVKDGQHRLDVVIKTGIAIESYVVFDMPNEVFETLGRGSRRTAADVCRIAGLDNVAAIASAARMIWAVTSQESIAWGLRSGQSITPSQLLRFRKNSDIKHIGSTVVLDSVMTAVAFITRKINPDLADEFIEGLQTGTELSSGSPILTARERIMNARARNERFHNDSQLHAVFTAWNAFAEKRPLKSIKSSLDNLRRITGLTEDLRAEIRSLFLSGANYV